jgi:hypothetical protein
VPVHATAAQPVFVQVAPVQALPFQLPPLQAVCAAEAAAQVLACQGRPKMSNSPVSPA